MKYFIILLLLATISTNLLCINEKQAKNFISDLTEGRTDKWVHPEEKAQSSRLGIKYNNIKHKWLISYDLDDEIASKIQNNQLDYKISITKLEKDFSKVIFSTSNPAYQKEFYFKDDKFISPVSYHTRNWKVLESKYFKFRISEPKQFHSESLKSLDDFVDKTLEILLVSKTEREKLQTQKINYVFCKHPHEIKKITGYEARGLYILASDTVISTFSCHYHEVTHLLINFKLENLPLFTHPFFQEGIAVALGGRGGKEPEIITDMGHFLEKSGFLSFKNLLSFDEFYQNDASLSYPLCGLYSKFLIETIGIYRYFELYKKYSSDFAVTQTINKNDLPAESEWEIFINQLEPQNKIIFPTEQTSNVIFENQRLKITEDENFYYFKTNLETIKISDTNRQKNYDSKLFKKLKPDNNYNGEKYLILASEAEINVYNLFTNNLIASYVKSFDLSDTIISKMNGMNLFAVKKEILELDFNNATFDLSN